MANIQENWQELLNSNTDKIRFQVFRGTSYAIEHLPKEDGGLYFAYDTGKIFLDKEIDGEVKRYTMSSTSTSDGNLGFLYANATEDSVPASLEEIEDEDNPGYYYMYRTAFENQLELAE